MYYVYLLECADKSIYTGIATDVERRFREHQAGTASRYTRSRKAKRLLYTEEHPDRGSALRREAAIKNMTRGEKLALISPRSKCILHPMKGYATDIERATRENTDFRRVLYTARGSQLVLMSIAPGSDIGEEVHDLDQFIRCEAGEGKAILDGVEHSVSDGFAILVPAGARHNIINTSTVHAMKLYTVYAPPNHKDGTVHATKADAEAQEEHFDGVTTE